MDYCEAATVLLAFRRLPVVLSTQRHCTLSGSHTFLLKAPEQLPRTWRKARVTWLLPASLAPALSPLSSHTALLSIPKAH